MNCERCMRAERAEYRAYSDIIDLRVCANCAAEAWELGLSIESLDHEPQLNVAGKLASLPRASRRIVGLRKGSHPKTKIGYADDRH
jgi:hypothetical protein